LRGAGHGVIEAADGDQGMQVLRIQNADAVVADLADSPLAGVELLTRIRANAATARTPVICCAAADRVRQTRRLVGTQAAVVASAPQPQTLLETLAQTIGAQPAPRPATDSPGYFGATLPRYRSNVARLGAHLDKRMERMLQAPTAPEAAGAFHTLNRRIAALLELNSALSSARDAQSMLEVFCRSARDIIECRHAALGILDPGGTRHVALAASGAEPSLRERLLAFDPTGSVLGEALTTPEPRRFTADNGRPTTLGLPPFHPPVRSLLVVPVPVRSPDALSGWLYFADRNDGAPFDEDDELLAATMAAQFVFAYGNLTLFDEVRRHARALEGEIAERRAAEQALVESELRLRQIATHIDSVFLLLDPDGSRIHYVSPAYERIWGVACAELYEQPRSWLAAVHPEDRAVADGVFRQDAAGSKCDVQFRIVRPDGELRWIQLRSFPIAGGDRRAYRTAAVAVDVTVAREVQNALQESNRRFSELLENIELASLMVDNEARITYCNAHLLRVTGWTREELLGKNAIEVLIAPQVRDEIQDRFEELVVGEGDLHREAEILTRAGERRLMRWNSTLLRNPDGKIVGIASIGEDVTEQRRAQAALARTLTHDRLTGLPRFSQIEEYLQSAIAEMVVGEGRVILIYVDMDGFHTVNETRGRAVGDHVLRVVARRLDELIGSAGRVAHVSGDEFAIAFKDPVAGRDQCEFAETIRAAVDQPIEHNGRNIYATCSVGVSCFPDNGSSPQELLRQAESALLRAKKEGRNTVFAFANEDKQELEDRINLGSRLDDALRNGEFLLHYQPRINGQDWRIGGFEALLRWQSPEFGLLAPGRFHQVAEDLGMMVDIGSYVIGLACRQARDWIDRGADDFSISINVSPSQMQRANFVDELRRALAEAKLPARYIELELTEGMTTGNFDRVIGTMRALKALGVKLSLDDFGTGYSSLNYLRKFPIDTLKIDRSFVRDISTDVGATGVCRAIITLAHQLGMTVLAEGVETAAQVGYLRRNDCDYFQGFYFCKPIPAAKAFEILQHRYLPHEGLEHTPTQPTLLLVDDEENILNALTRMLRRDGYRILTARGAEEALDVLARNDVQVILSDQRMPGASGTEFLSKVKGMYPDTVRMVLSGYTELAAVTAAINEGAIYKFLTKPWNDDELRLQIRDAFRIAQRPKEQNKRELP
jgi:diguanylate cyclase (GGDEF)-like protein/PAS domain S-box-containing protein